MAEHDDHALEDAFRASLQRRADRVDVSAPIARRAMAASRRRRQGLVVVAAAAVAVAAVTTAGAVLVWGEPDTPTDPPVADRSSDDPALSDDWRTEHWHNLTVEVPEEWGWGAAPNACGIGAVVGPAGERGVDFHTTPYVGRPISNTDICAPPPDSPQAPYVWLGADVEPGILDLGGGYVQETVKLAGTTVTVASDSTALRRRVLNSAFTIEPRQMCDPQTNAVPQGRTDVPGGEGDLRGPAFACAYARADGKPYRLVAGSVLPLAAYEQLESLVSDAPDRPAHCKDVPEYVVVTGWYGDPEGDLLVNERVFELACGVVDLGSGARVRATQEQLDTWRRGVFDVTLSYFIGPQG